MQALNVTQLQHESDSWKRLLLLMLNENVYMNNRLSHMRIDEFCPTILEDITKFQHFFAKEKEKIAVLGSEITALDNLLFKKAYVDEKIQEKVNEKAKKLRSEIATKEKQFADLKLQFRKYLLENSNRSEQ